MPALFCFPQILQHRLRSINAAFKRARESYGYNGDYFLVYPIKVNQHRRVIESLIHSGEPLGLEAGSKAELMAVLAHAGMTRSVIVCNGYKDREYIRLALVGEKMGHKVYLVIEKMSEIAIVLEEAERLNVVPRLGVRARLASQGSGKWQSSGGEKSKFGLAATQVLQLVEILREAGHLESLQLLHFHLGSQMANIRDIATGVRESVRFYVELHKLGVNIQCFDVGGGLGVDYEGTRSQSDCSVNYGLNEYANNIIWAIGDACEENGLPHPTVITESGRAVTAHHTVLVSNIIGVERNEYTEATPPAEDAARPLQSMWETWLEMHETGNRRSLREWLHDSQMDLHDIHIGYSSGTFNLQERAWAEQLYLNMCHEVQKQLDPSNRAHRPIIDELQERMADKIYVNFSLFQSMPDAWGIDQLFGDAAGRAEQVAGAPRGAAGHHLRFRWRHRSLRGRRRDRHHHADAGIRPGEPADAGLLHGWRLSGDPRQHAQPVRRYRGGGRVRLPDGSVEVELSDEGDTVADMLQYVQLDPNTLLTQFRDQVKNTGLDDALQQQFLEEFEAGLYGYTYLEDE